MWQVLKSVTARGAVVLVAGFGVAACGGDDDSAGGEGAAALAPADTAIYVELAVRPEGEDADAIEAIAARFPGGGDLGETIVNEINDSFAEENQGELTYEEDIEPWLGERGAVVFSSPADLEDEAQPSVIVEATDEDAAQQFIDDGFASDEDPERDAEYEGVSYTVDSEQGDAIAVVEGSVVVAGDEQRMRELIDVGLGNADSLADAEGFSYDAGDLSGDDALAFVRLDTPRLVELAVASDPAPEVTTDQATEIAQSIGFDLGRPMTFALAATSDAARLDASIPIVEGTYPESESTELLGSLPGDSLLASACGACVNSFAELFEFGFAQAAAEDGVSEEQALQRLEDRTGLDLEELRDALGGVAFFVRGVTPVDLDGAAVVEVRDEAAVSEGLESLTLLAQGILSAQRGAELRELPPLPGATAGFTVSAPDLPTPIHVALAGDRLVVALGENAASDALEPGETLASRGTLESAESTLGGDLEPTALLDLDGVFDLARAFAGGDPGFREAEPYLDPFARLVAGARADGDELVSSLVVSFE
jgi:Protein of unknown function (DUF3352)